MTETSPLDFGYFLYLQGTSPTPASRRNKTTAARPTASSLFQDARPEPQPLLQASSSKTRFCTPPPPQSAVMSPKEWGRARTPVRGRSFHEDQAYYDNNDDDNDSVVFVQSPAGLANVHTPLDLSRQASATLANASSSPAYYEYGVPSSSPINQHEDFEEWSRRDRERSSAPSPPDDYHFDHEYPRPSDFSINEDIPHTESNTLPDVSDILHPFVWPPPPASPPPPPPSSETYEDDDDDNFVPPTSYLPSQFSSNRRQSLSLDQVAALPPYHIVAWYLDGSEVNLPLGHPDNTEILDAYYGGRTEVLPPGEYFWHNEHGQETTLRVEEQPQPNHVEPMLTQYENGYDSEGSDERYEDVLLEDARVRCELPPHQEDLPPGYVIARPWFARSDDDEMILSPTHPIAAMLLAPWRWHVSDMPRGDIYRWRDELGDSFMLDMGPPVGFEDWDPEAADWDDHGDDGYDWTEYTNALRRLWYYDPEDEDDVDADGDEDDPDAEGEDEVDEGIAAYNEALRSTWSDDDDDYDGEADAEGEPDDEYYWSDADAEGEEYWSEEEHYQDNNDN